MNSLERSAVLVGEERELRARIAGLLAAGRLQPDGLLAQGRRPDGSCYARVRLLPAAQPPRRRWSRPFVVVAAVGAFAVVGFIAIAVFLAVQWVLAHLAAIVGVLIVAAILAVVLLPSAVKHCPGCRG